MIAAQDEVRSSAGTSVKRDVFRAMGRSTFFGAVASAAQFLTRIVTVPIVISHLGLDGYGIWSIVMTIAAYMRFGSVGVKSAFQKYVAECTETREYDRTNRLLSTGTTGMFLLSILGLLPACVWSSRIAHAAGVPQSFQADTAAAISLLALIMTVSNTGAAFEAIVMGSHRIDLVRKFNTVTTIGEAIAIVVLLHRHYGLFAMAAVMAISEILYVLFCYVQARRAFPNIHVSVTNIDLSVIKELVRYAGSYQLVNILEVLYTAVLPIAILRVFGADSSGVYALCLRLVSAALMLQEAFLQPVLSGGSAIIATGNQEAIVRFLVKTFRTYFFLALPPLAFVAAFGKTIVLAWTGENRLVFTASLLIISIGTLFKSFSLLGLVLYRASGRAIIDNIRQILRIIFIVAIGLLARPLGFNGLLTGFALTEFVGMFVMYYAVSKEFPGLRLKEIARKTSTITSAVMLSIGCGALTFLLPLGATSRPRTQAAFQLVALITGCLAATYPSIVLTRCLSRNERQVLASTFKRKLYAFQ
jgi:O-antigen/teichoic acid export membrane protein